MFLVGYRDGSTGLNLHSTHVHQCTYFGDTDNGLENVVEVAVHQDLAAYGDDEAYGFVTPVPGLGDDGFLRPPSELTAVIDGAVYKVSYIPLDAGSADLALEHQRRVLQVLVDYVTGTGTLATDADPCTAIVAVAESLAEEIEAFLDGRALDVAELSADAQETISNLMGLLGAVPDSVLPPGERQEAAAILAQAAAALAGEDQLEGFQEAFVLMGAAVDVVERAVRDCVEA